MQRQHSHRGNGDVVVRKTKVVRMPRRRLLRGNGKRVPSQPLSAEVVERARRGDDEWTKAVPARRNWRQRTDPNVGARRGYDEQCVFVDPDEIDFAIEETLTYHTNEANDPGRDWITLYPRVDLVLRPLPEPVADASDKMKAPTSLKTYLSFHAGRVIKPTYVKSAIRGHQDTILTTHDLRELLRHFLVDVAGYTYCNIAFDPSHVAITEELIQRLTDPNRFTLQHLTETVSRHVWYVGPTYGQEVPFYAQNHDDGTVQRTLEFSPALGNDRWKVDGSMLWAVERLKTLCDDVREHTLTTKEQVVDGNFYYADEISLSPDPDTALEFIRTLEERNRKAYTAQNRYYDRHKFFGVPLPSLVSEYMGTDHVPAYTWEVASALKQDTGAHFKPGPLRSAQEHNEYEDWLFEQQRA